MQVEVVVLGLHHAVVDLGVRTVDPCDRIFVVGKELAQVDHAVQRGHLIVQDDLICYLLFIDTGRGRNRIPDHIALHDLIVLGARLAVHDLVLNNVVGAVNHDPHQNAGDDDQQKFDGFIQASAPFPVF